jgi:hypothetical protein
MSKVRILLRWFLLITAALVISTCQSASDAYAPSPGGGALAANPCRSGGGKADRNAPIVCVDDSADTLSVDPDPITAHSVGKADRQPVMIHWWTKSGGNALNLEIQAGCVTEVKCNGAHCSARTLPVTERKQCKYDVWTDKHPKLDPDIVIDPCC